ncbi:MAG: SDR family NAD(P)-dependent oxidoreductase [Campylobacterales bacterium]|nr:SDR family NAD(P)-dependent oxidoreductase [Campylobacterales bacterium]
MTILITGASSGIGAKLAKHYAKIATNLILVARDEQRLKQLKDELDSYCHVEIFSIDLSNLFDVKNRFLQIKECHESFDLIILNAGVSLGHNKEITDFEENLTLLNTNFTSNMLIIDLLLPKLAKNSKIVFISSLASYITMPSSIAYSTSKRAMNSYAEGLRNALYKKDIHVINIKPGFVDTPLTKKNSFKMPFFMDLDTAIKKIVYAIDTNKKEYSFPKMFYLIIKIISLLPATLKDKAIRYANFKKQ